MHRLQDISHEMNVVVVSNQSANSNKNLLCFHWILTTTAFVPWNILEAMSIIEYIVYLQSVTM